jgi:hypothetical protein
MRSLKSTPATDLVFLWYNAEKTVEDYGVGVEYGPEYDAVPNTR